MEKGIKREFKIEESKERRYGRKGCRYFMNFIVKSITTFQILINV
jgi:hypothetical protein